MSSDTNSIPEWILEVEHMAAENHAHHSLNAWDSPLPRLARYPKKYIVKNVFRKFQAKIFADLLDKIVSEKYAGPHRDFLENTRRIMQLIATCDARDSRASKALDRTIILHREAVSAVRSMAVATEAVFRLADNFNEWDEESADLSRFAAPLKKFAPLLSEAGNTLLDFMWDIAQSLSFQGQADRESNADISHAIQVAVNSIGVLSYGQKKQEDEFTYGPDEIGGWDHHLMHQAHLEVLENQLECLTSALDEASKVERMPSRKIGDPPRRWVDVGDD